MRPGCSCCDFIFVAFTTIESKEEINDLFPTENGPSMLMWKLEGIDVSVLLVNRSARHSMPSISELRLDSESQGPTLMSSLINASAEVSLKPTHPKEGGYLLVSKDRGIVVREGGF